MNQIPLYPLRFEPIYQYRLWGGRRLANLLVTPLLGDGPIGEAWLLSDREDHQSLVADGPLKGQTLGQLLEKQPEQMLGKLVGPPRRTLFSSSSAYRILVPERPARSLRSGQELS